MKRRAAIALAVAGLLTPVAEASPALAGPTDLLPDLQMAPIYSLQLKTSAAGRKRLRFGTVVQNVGDGPIEVRASDRNGREMQTIVQSIHASDGSARALAKPDARAFYSGDNHDHFHIARFIVARLTPLPGNTATTVRKYRKIGFCLVDTSAMTSDQPPNAAPSRSYLGCGTRSSESVRMGISVGWVDVYAPELKRQSIDVTDLPTGDYRLCVTVNRKGLWTERGDNRSNNSYWLEMALDVAADRLSVIATGSTPC